LTKLTRSGFFFSLDRNLEDVDQFYNKKYSDFSRRLKLLEDRYGSLQDAAQQLDTEDTEDLIAALLELRGQMRKLQWYGEVNRRGFIKITKKLDKKIPSAHSQKQYLALKVDPSAFATNVQLGEAVSKINDWISGLSEAAAKRKADPKSSPAPSLHHSNSRPALRIAPERFAALEQHVRGDEAAELIDGLEEVTKITADTGNVAFQQLLKNLLQRAIFSRSRLCIKSLLDRIVYLDDAEDINKRNCIHRLVVSIGRALNSPGTGAEAATQATNDAEKYNFLTPAALPTLPTRKTVPQEPDHVRSVGRDDSAVALLQYLLDQLHPSQRSGLMSRDTFGRTPLHLAARYGVRVVCEILTEHLKKWRLFNLEQGIDGPAWQDNEGWAPVHLAAIGGHPLTTEVLLLAGRREHTGATSDTVLRQDSPRSSAALLLATKADFVEIVRILVQAGVDINQADDQGETALHVAARFGHDECARILLAGSATHQCSTELPEKTYGWTPLLIAAVDGNLGVVELLIEAGADLYRQDSSGWNAKEHASLRGHISIAMRLAEVTAQTDADSDTSTSASTSPPSSTSLTDRKSNGYAISNGTSKITDPVKTFGHRYLTDKSMVLVSLGTMDVRKNVEAVNLDNIPLINAHSTQLDTALSIVISADGADGEPEIFDLPVQDNVSTEPVVFHASDPTKVKLLFDLIPTYSGSKDRIFGRGVALLSTIRPSIGSKRMFLQGDLTVPLMASTTMDVIGSVTFNFLIITPFKHPNMSITENQTYWKSMTSTMVIGHRGLGKNISGRRSLQLGENTIQSFIAAANLGASYVEFDVQLTKDHVPVIYHDFLVSETGIDAPVHTLTLEQFLHVNDVRTPRPSRPASPVTFENPKLRDLKSAEPRMRRSMSVGGSDAHDSSEMDERMKHTRDFKKKGFKGNSRGNHIHSPFATLEEMFKKLPASVGFNIEMKYPMLFEFEDEEVDTYAVELNSFVDTVLTKVYDLGKGRQIIFSSFNPDICLLLSFKQPSIPVLFLTDSGTFPVGDIRASSLQEAIRFASRWNLLGVVSAAEPLVISPRLVRVVKESGLVCVSYGTLNNDASKVQLQVKQGIDAVIVDSVLAIRKELTEGSAKLNGANGQLNGEQEATINTNGTLNVPVEMSVGDGLLKPRPKEIRKQNGA
jgi:glycerophosphodiester phosphodiesterase